MNQPQSPLFTARIVTGAIALSVVVLMVIAHVIPGSDANLPDIALWGLSGIAGAIYLISFILPPIILKSALAKLPKDKRSEQAFFAAWFPSHVITLALREAPAILGFVITFVSLDTSYVISFGIVSLFLILKEWPRDDLFDSLSK